MQLTLCRLSPRIHYKNSPLSPAFIVAALLAFAKFVVPFLCLYYAGGFWLQQNVLYQQPTIAFTGDAVIFIGNDSSCCCASSIAGYTPNCGCTNTACGISLMEYNEGDSNFDSIPDSLAMTLLLTTNFVPTKMSFAGVVHLTLTKVETSFRMTGLIHVEQTASSICSVSLHGSLILDQTSPLDPYDNYNIDFFNTSRVATYLDVLNHYYNQKVYVDLKENFVGFSPSACGSSVEVNLDINYPEIPIHYSPSIGERIKFGWVQYVSLFVLFGFVCDRIKAIVFTSRVVHSIAIEESIKTD